MIRLKNILLESKVGHLVEKKGDDKVDPKKQKILDKEIKYKDKDGKQKKNHCWWSIKTRKRTSSSQTS